MLHSTQGTVNKLGKPDGEEIFLCSEQSQDYLAADKGPDSPSWGLRCKQSSRTWDTSTVPGAAHVGGRVLMGPATACGPYQHYLPLGQQVQPCWMKHAVQLEQAFLELAWGDSAEIGP